MLVPLSSPAPTGPVLDEPRDMAVALRLLSGKDCERDASTAHTMLLRLSESRSASIREDATRVLRAGVANQWFTERTPKHYELERIAEKTLARRDQSDQKRRLVVAVGIGLAAFLGGLIAFVANSDSANVRISGQAVIAVLILLILVAAVFFRSMSHDL